MADKKDPKRRTPRVREHHRRTPLARPDSAEDGRGNPSGDDLAVLDELTRRTRADEEALGASEGRCQILFDVVPQPMLVYRLDTLRFIAVNDAAVRHYGYSRQEFFSMSIDDLCLPDDGPRSDAESSSLDPAGPPGLQTTWRHRQKDGTPIDVAVSGVSLIFNGRPARVIAVNDITERKRAEEALALLRTLFDNLPGCIYLKDTESRFLVANIACARHMGAKIGEELLGRTDFDFYPPDLASRYFDDEREVLRSGEPLIDREEPVKDAAGNTNWLLTTKVPFSDGLGKIAGLAGLGCDITERKRAEEALRESEEKWRSLVENAPNFISTVDRDGRILFLNRAQPGIDHRAVIGSSVYDYIVPQFRESVRATFERAFRTREPDSYEVLGAGPHGTNAWYQSNVSALTREGQVVGLLVIATDITERKRAEEDLRQLSSRLLRSQDEERRGIARELHDATSQTLAALAINLGVVNESAGSLKPEAREALGDSFRLLETCTREIRTMSYLLHPPMLEELSLPGALHWYTRGFTERSGTRVDLEMPSELGDVPGDVALTLYRIVQESLANIYRHSGSRSATIRLSREPSEIVLRVADRGRGIPPGVLERNLGKQRSESSPGVGITGMKERVRQLGGRLEIQSGIQGTTVTVVLPLRQKRARSAGSSG